MATPRDPFDAISPLDYRYWDEEVASYLSENAFTAYKLRVEVALLKVLHRRGLCPQEVVDEVETASEGITTAEVYEEEQSTRHDIRALVNCLQRRVSPAARPFVHMTATSYDIIDSANAARFRDAVDNVLIPALKKLEAALIGITSREAQTVQVGRTHGQHAVPVTFGFALAEYVSRLGLSIETLEELATQLPGKFSGAVGAYNASSLFFDDPQEFEREVLAQLRLKPAQHSTQIVPPEAFTRLFCEIAIVTGILANIADDMRHLQRTEIAEVGEEFKSSQVGSSTMPHKSNPINFENVKSSWKIVMPRLVTVLMDQISEHQRDLTNSASARTYGEMIAYVVSAAKRLTRTMRALKVGQQNIVRNLNLQKDLIAAEPLYLILASMGHPDAHEHVRLIALKARTERKGLMEVASADPDMQPYLLRMTQEQQHVLENPADYTGKAAQKAASIAEYWRQHLAL